MTAYRRAWTMDLREGAEEAYDAAHAAIWPELLEQMHANGIRQFYLFRSGTTIFAFQERDRPFPERKAVPDATTARWWSEMAPLMNTDPQGRPIHHPLNEVFAMNGREND